MTTHALDEALPRFALHSHSSLEVYVSCGDSSAILIEALLGARKVGPSSLVASRSWGSALAFLGVFFYLAARFQYPEVLDGNAEDVLPALLATGRAGRAAWALYALLPLAFIPAGVSAFAALRTRSAGPMRVGMLFALVAALSMMIGLMRWPSIHWELGIAWNGATDDQRLILAAVFDGLNRYLGNYIGEFLGELSFSVFFVLSGIGMLRQERAPIFLGWWGIVTGFLGLIGMWRNFTGAVAFVADANNYLLPTWMIAFGVWLIVESRRTADDPLPSTVTGPV